MNIYLEIFGYIGTLLVIVSMMMTSVLKLRIFNMCGGVISLIYAVFCNAWPVVLMNFCLLIINFIHTVRHLRQKHNFGHSICAPSDQSVAYFLEHFKEDIEKFFPSHRIAPHPNTEIHLIFVESEMVGILVGTRAADVYRIEMDYVTPRYRDISVGEFLFPRLKEEGINMLTAPVGTDEHNKYLSKLGFSDDGGILIKDL